MDREQILALYTWRPGICFRHPSKGRIDTTVVKRIRIGKGEREIRACRDCVISMEDIRRETAARTGSEYEPGHAGETLG